MEIDGSFVSEQEKILISCPKEIWGLILMFLSLVDISSLSKTNKYFLNIGKQYFNILKQKIPISNLYPDDILFYTLKQSCKYFCFFGTYSKLQKLLIFCGCETITFTHDNYILFENRTKIYLPDLNMFSKVKETIHFYLDEKWLDRILSVEQYPYTKSKNKRKKRKNVSSYFYFNAKNTNPDLIEGLSDSKKSEIPTMCLDGFILSETWEKKSILLKAQIKSRSMHKKFTQYENVSSSLEIITLQSLKNQKSYASFLIFDFDKESLTIRVSDTNSKSKLHQEKQLILKQKQSISKKFDLNCSCLDSIFGLFAPSKELTISLVKLLGDEFQIVFIIGKNTFSFR